MGQLTRDVKGFLFDNWWPKYMLHVSLNVYGTLEPSTTAWDPKFSGV